jgi:hypothetical protein
MWDWIGKNAKRSLWKCKQTFKTTKRHLKNTIIQRHHNQIGKGYCKIRVTDGINSKRHSKS